MAQAVARQPLVPGCAQGVKFSSRAGKVGLKNLGNTCFMNAGLQCLCHIEPLVAYFLNGDFEEDVNVTSPLSNRGALAKAFAELQRALWQSEQSVHNPCALHRKLTQWAPHLFESYQQQDVQEFLAFCLDGLHEDLNRVAKPPPPISEKQEQEDERLAELHGQEFAAALTWCRHLERGKSFFVDLLQGQLRSSLTCLTCGHTSRRFDPFLYLSVPVTKDMSNVTDAISKYLEKEVLEGDEKWHCEKCKRKVSASKKIDLWKLPPVLVLHLKRFDFDAKTQKFEKTENRLNMKLSSLDLTEFCSSDQRDGATYSVTCVANHSGAFGSGHYTATCRVGGPGPSSWHYFNDSTVTPMKDGRSVVTRETYVIFLVRDGDPGDIAVRSSGSSGRGRRSAPSRKVILRRQTLSAPGNWPHPEALVSAVLSATGTPSDGDGASSSGGDGAVDGKEPEEDPPAQTNGHGPPAGAEPLLKRQRTMREYFAHVGSSALGSSALKTAR
mmetsp:Transcript_32975/g.87139  ORF Transcript_32975/g.87139 Transcript_32975/m.87139 type:complete len:497 (+) Transcript_32975:67-1557(+)